MTPLSFEVALGFCLGLLMMSFVCIFYLFRELRRSGIHCPKCDGPPRYPVRRTCARCGCVFEEHSDGAQELEGCKRVSNLR